MLTPEYFNKIGERNLPGHVGIHITFIGPSEVRSEMDVTEFLLSPNGYLHAASIVALADTSAGYGCAANLPDKATGFTTIELKSNHLGTTLEGTIQCTATAVHLGRTTQLWDAVVTHKQTGKTLALFRCTQLIIYGK